MSQEVTIKTSYPNRWSDMFMKTNTTPFVKRDYKVDHAKCLKLVREQDGTQTLTYIVSNKRIK